MLSGFTVAPLSSVVPRLHSRMRDLEMSERALRQNPNAVFTPRASEVNPRMYIHRPKFEESLLHALSGSKHMLLYGESGTGKSWLYKYVFSSSDVSYLVANMSNALRLKGLDAEFRNLANRKIGTGRVGYDERKTAGVGGVFVGNLSHNDRYELVSKEPFELCLEYLRKEAKEGKRACLVFDNLEQVLESPELIKDIASCLILLDDEAYASYDVRILLVGAPADVERYFGHLHNAATIVNRIAELPEISRLEEQEAQSLVVRGFEDELGVKIFEKETVLKDILFISDRIPQFIHEVCLCLAEEVLRSKRSVVTWSLLTDAALRWSSMSLASSYAAVDRHLKLGEETDLLTQMVYCLGLERWGEIDPEEVRVLLVQHFPESTAQLEASETDRLVNGMLKDLAEASSPIIRLMPNGRTYRFVRPQYRICLRAMIYKAEDEFVRRIDREEIHQWQVFSGVL